MDETKDFSPKKIMETVADFYGVTIKGILGKNRTKKLVRSRHVVAYLLREELRMSYPAIGSKIGARDHTTAIHAYQRIKNALGTDSALRREIENIKAIIRGSELRLLWKPKGIVKEIIKDRVPIAIPSGLRWSQLIKKAKIPVSPVVRERERSILEEWRFGKTLEQIGKEWKLTRERIRQIITKAIFREIAAKINEGLEIDVGEFLKQEKIRHGALRDQRLGKLKAEEKIKETEKIKAPGRWSRYYARCKTCGTTIIPHRSKGLCERCYGIIRNREEIISKAGGRCENCEMDRATSFQKFGRDLYVTLLSRERDSVSDYLVLCRSCFSRLAGKRMAAARKRKTAK